MHRIEIDVQTGEQTIIEFTPEEEAAALAYAASLPPSGPTREELQAQIAALQTQIDAMP